jgi:hypothetical protein
MRTRGGAAVAAAAGTMARGPNAIVIGWHQAVAAAGNQETINEKTSEFGGH